MNFVGIPAILVIISIIVTFHELGHFWVARLFKTRVERFSVGFGKILLRRKDKNGVEWCLSALPFGGYVKFAGDENISSMMPSQEDLEASRALILAREGEEAVGEYFHFKPLWQRFLIILAGPMANFVLAIAIFFVMIALFGQMVGRPVVRQVNVGSPAEAAGFRVNDVLVAVEHRKVDTGVDFQRMIALRSNTSTIVTVERNTAMVDLIAMPKRGELYGADGKPLGVQGGVLGIGLTDSVVPRRVGIGEAFVLGCRQTWDVLATNLTYIGRIFIGKEDGKQLGGIVGMAKASGDMAVDATKIEGPWWYKALNLILNYVNLTAFISIGVGFVNLLPIPVLDGGHLAFYAYQSVAKKPVSAGFQNLAFRIAIVLILGLMLFANWNDLSRILFAGHSS